MWGLDISNSRRFLIQRFSRLLLLMKVEERLRLDLGNLPDLLITNSQFIVIDGCGRRALQLIVT